MSTFQPFVKIKLKLKKKNSTIIVDNIYIYIYISVLSLLISLGYLGDNGKKNTTNNN